VIAALVLNPGRLLRELVILTACAPLAYYLFAILAAVRFFAARPNKSATSFTPPVSILKPVCGVDFASYQNFKSFCVQDYPEYEILFCVNDLKDAAVPLIHQLTAEFPEHRIRLLADAPQLGANRKVNNLVLLAQEAKFELLVQSDGDVRVAPNYLRDVVAPFAQSGTGVVSCFYRGIAQPNLWAEMEALGAATDFSAGALVADWMEGVTFALGASVATTKTWLGKVGGYAALANVLADDYEIGNRIAKSGARVMLSREVVATMYPAMSFTQFWQHQLRWARTVRLCRPASYVGLLFTHGLPWAVVGALASGSPAGVGAFFVAYLLLRTTLAWTVGVWALHDDTTRRKLWLVPLRDALHFCVWLGSFFSNRITWGDSEFRLSSTGEMVEINSSKAKNRAETAAKAG